MSPRLVWMTANVCSATSTSRSHASGGRGILSQAIEARAARASELASLFAMPSRLKLVDRREHRRARPAGHGSPGKEHVVMCRCPKSTLVRSVVLLAVLGAGTAMAWRVLELPHSSDDSVHTEAASP